MNRVEICGGIATGKTTLASQFGIHGYKLVLERFRENPFFEVFYQNPVKFAFETEVTFLLQHYNSIQIAIESKSTIIVDTSIIQDLSYADINLEGSKYDAFKGVYDVVRDNIGLPSVLVHIECSSDVQLERIRARARPEEKPIEKAYLDGLNASIEKRVDQLRDQIPVFTVDSGAVDFRGNDNSAKQIIDTVGQLLN